MRQQSTAPRRASLTNGASPSIHRFCRDPGVPMVDFARGQRKDDIARDYLAGFEAEGHTEGVLFVGRAQEKTPSGQGGEDFRGRTGVWAWLSDHPRHREVQAPTRYSGGRRPVGRATALVVRRNCVRRTYVQGCQLPFGGSRARNAPAEQAAGSMRAQAKAPRRSPVDG